MSDFELPNTHYAVSGDVNIAYQAMGEGPRDIILVPGIVSHVEFSHERPGYTSFLRRLSTFGRIVTFDKRGQGLSDRVSDAASLEQRVDDVRAIMEDIGSQRAVLLGISEGASMSAFFAATYPERVSQLILYGGFTKSYAKEEAILQLVKLWGTGALIKALNPSQATNQEAVNQLAKFERLSASPGAFKAYVALNRMIDVTSILPIVRVPTLVLHRRTDALVPVERGRELAAQIPGAQYIEYPDGEHPPWIGNVEALLGDIQEFVTGDRESSAFDLERVLATVLLTDIVDSTRSAAEMGDQRWSRLLDRHDEIARRVVEKHRGHLVKSTGDGILATFDGPGRAVRCALAIETAVKQIGLRVRAGLHTGEIELRGRDVGGITVHAAARVMACCAPSEVVVSRVVTDLVAGTGLKFSERGSHELKGLPGRWDLFAANL
ncbi:Adenylate cyclase, class 3 [Rhizobiales bacterium GAS113]|nr:Adenylate cyclase, class 3 [Rhizobiales bacterium GAS113]